MAVLVWTIREGIEVENGRECHLYTEQRIWNTDSPRWVGYVFAGLDRSPRLSDKTEDKLQRMKYQYCSARRCLGFSNKFDRHTDWI